MKTKFIIFVVFIVLLVGGFGVYLNKNSGPKAPGPLDGFAQCLKNNGAEFYGTFWCSHCQNQKKLFGKSQKYLPYIECSTADGQGQLPVCKDKEIQGYPTWIFANGERLSGEVSLETLAEKTQCLLP